MKVCRFQMNDWGRLMMKGCGWTQPFTPHRKVPGQGEGNYSILLDTLFLTVSVTAWVVVIVFEMSCLSHFCLLVSFFILCSDCESCLLNVMIYTSFTCLVFSSSDCHQVLDLSGISPALMCYTCLTS